MRAVFPFAHRVALRITLQDTTLRVETTVHATGDDPVPVSFGFHPYLVPPGAPRAAWKVQLLVLTHLALDERGLPTGAREPMPAERFALGERTYDDLFAIEGDTARFAGDLAVLLLVRLRGRLPVREGSWRPTPVGRRPPGRLRRLPTVHVAGLGHQARLVALGERATAAFALRVD